MTYSTSWTDYNKYLENIKNIGNEIKQQQGKLQLEKDKKPLLTDELNHFRSNLSEVKIEVLAHKLRDDLKNDEICPVCGSMHHQKENLKFIKIIDTSTIEKEIELKDTELKQIGSTITAIETMLVVHEKNKQTNIDNITQLGEDFKHTTIEKVNNKFENLSEQLSNYNIEKEANESIVNQVTTDFTKATGDVTNIQNLLNQNKEGLTDEIKKYDYKLEELKPIKTKYEDLKEELGIKDFTAKSKEIKAVEEEIEKHNTNIKNNRNAIKEINNNLEALAPKKTQIIEKLAGNTSALSEKNIAKSDLKKRILEKVENIDTINEDITKVNSEIDDITNSYKDKQKELEEISRQYNISNDAFNTICGTLEAMYNSCDGNEKLLIGALKTYDYLTKEEVKFDIQVPHVN